MSKYDVNVSGAVCTVQVIKLHSMPIVGQSETVINPESCMTMWMGGCSYNIWKALAKLGAKTCPVFHCSSPLCYENMLKDCDEVGAEKKYITYPLNENYYHCIMFQNDDNEHITISMPYGKDVKDPTKSMNALSYLPEQFDCKYVLAAVSADDTWLDLAEKNGCEIIFSYRNDPVLCPKEMMEKLMYKSHYIFMNEVEAEYVCKTLKLKSITDLLVHGRAEVVVTTLGKEGSLVYFVKEDGSVGCERVGITEAPGGCVDAVGAGDGFVAGFTYGLIEGKNIRTCAQFGHTVSSFVIEKEGSVTNVPSLEQMLERNATRKDASFD